MRTIIQTVTAAAAVAVSSFAFAGGPRCLQFFLPRSDSAAVQRPQIEVCFVLDTTGSMGGLIAGAKAKIWSIANQVVSATPTPRVRFGLVAYRDRGDAYITRVRDLSEDIDAVYAELQTFEAGGGGDGPESVNQALHEALTRMTWSADDKTLKIIFLVGDAPPHMDYANDVHYPVTCEAAARRGIVVNTIQCGNMPDTDKIWREIARKSEGQFAAIGQTGDVQVVETPMDTELATLNIEIGKTLVPYGDSKEREGIVAKQARAESAPAAAAADRLRFMDSAGRAVAADERAGGGDLVDDLKAGRVKLAEVKDEQLPDELRKLPAEKRTERIDQLGAQRAQVQTKIAQLVRDRQAYIDKELAKRAESGQKEGFDQKVASILVEQAARKGIKLAKNP
jgi:Mg-chelatase subunit ChlD